LQPLLLRNTCKITIFLQALNRKNLNAIRLPVSWQPLVPDKLTSFECVARKKTLSAKIGIVHVRNLFIFD